MREPASHAYRFAVACMRQLESSGVGFIVISPGFRSSPFHLAARRCTKLQVVDAVEERGAAFFAIGLAQSRRAPVALLCTSGTAAGNYLPAVMEASLANVPLILLTADRPQELIGTGANQCTEQHSLFGAHVRHFADTAPPGGEPGEAELAMYLIARAVSRAGNPQPGPVHLNLRLREPFLPPSDLLDELESLDNARPWSFLASATGPSEDQAMAMASLLKAAKRPLLVLGPGPFGQRLLGRVATISAATGIPVAAEPASGLAYCECRQPPSLLHRPERLFAAMAAGALAAPDLLVRIGRPLTGRALTGLLRAGAVTQVIVDEWGEAREPSLHPSVFISGDPESWLSADTLWGGAQAELSWRESLLAFEKKLEERISTHLSGCDAFTEWHFHRHLLHHLHSGASLLLGNSMPIRDFNAMAPAEAPRLRIFANRGLSGIDGLIATAAGVALGGARETHALLGDLSALHDLPSLAFLSALRDRLNLTIWVINNQGGEIFRNLPTARSGGKEEWFTTPQGFDLSAIAKAFRTSYTRVHDLSSLEALGSELFTSPGVRLIEVLVSQAHNTKIRNDFPPPA